MKYIKKRKQKIKQFIISLAAALAFSCVSNCMTHCISLDQKVQTQEPTTGEITNNIVNTETSTVKNDAPTASEISKDGVSIYDASDFVNLSEYIGKILVELRYYSGFNFTGNRVPGYDEQVALLHKDAAKALKKVSDEVNEKGYCLKIWDAYRPQTAVTYFMDWCENENATEMKKFFYPEITKKVILDEGYLWSESKHCKGGTVDLTLVDMNTGQNIDMGGPFDYFGKLSNYAYEKLTDQQKENRKFLRDVMCKHGFQKIDCEWWHFNYKNHPYPNTSFDFTVCNSNAGKKEASKAKESQYAKEKLNEVKQIKQRENIK